MNSQNFKEIQLELWQPQFVEGKHWLMCLLAPRNQGKSTLLRDLFIKNNFINKFDIFVVFSNSLSNAISRDFFAEFVPGELHFDEFRPEIVDYLFAVNEKMMKKGEEPYNILFIFDDCVDVKQKYMDNILQVFTRGRNKNMSVIFTSQMPSLMNKTWRINCDYAILLNEKDMGNRELNITNFMTGVYDKQVYCKRKPKEFLDNLYVRNMKDHWVIVCDFTGAQNNMYRYKADPNVKLPKCATNEQEKIPGLNI